MELKIAIDRKVKLQDSFDKIDNKLEKDLRLLKWQQKKRCPKNGETTIREQPQNCARSKIMENINSSMFNFSKTGPEIKKHQVLPNNEEQKKVSAPLSDKIKILQNNIKNDIGGKFGNQCLKRVAEFGYEMLRDQLYDQSFYNDSKVIRNHSKSMTLDDRSTKKIKNTEKLEWKNPTIRDENRVVYNIEDDDTGVVRDVKLFQKLFRGRTYQTMIMMAKIRLKPFLQSAESAVPSQTTAHYSTPVTRDGNYQDDVLELYTKRYVSRFFDTISKESVRKDEESKNAMMVELAEAKRAMREAYEGNRRQLEQAAREEQDEMLRQVLEIHQGLSDQLFEEFLKNATEQCANEEGLKLLEDITSKMVCSEDKLYNINGINIENELVFNTIIPEANKIIHRNTQID